LAEQAGPATPLLVRLPCPFNRDGRESLMCIEWRLIKLKKFDEEDEMLVATSIGFLLLIWVIVLWGSTYFNHNIH
jgi:hypothetical protein